MKSELHKGNQKNYWKCSKCGWHYTEASPGDVGSSLLACYHKGCGMPSSYFLPVRPEDLPLQASTWPIKIP